MNRTMVAATLVVAGAWARVRSPRRRSHDSDAADARRRGVRASVRRRRGRALRARGQPRGSRSAGAARRRGRPASDRRRSAARATRRWSARRPRTAAGLLPRQASVLNWSVVALAGAGDRRAAGRADRPGGRRGSRAGPPCEGRRAGGRGRRPLPLTTRRSRRRRRCASRPSWRRRRSRWPPTRTRAPRRRSSPGVEADVARAEAARIGLARFEAERRLSDAEPRSPSCWTWMPQRLALPNALPAAPLRTLPSGSLEDQALGLRGEVAAAEMERQVLERRLALVRRERVPNPTLSGVLRARRNQRPHHRRRALHADSAAVAGRAHARGRDRRDAGADPRRGELAGAGPPARSAGGGAGAVGLPSAERRRGAVRRRSAGARPGRPFVVAGGDRDRASSRCARGCSWQRSLIELLAGGHRRAPRARARLGGSAASGRSAPGFRDGR